MAIITFENIETAKRTPQPTKSKQELIIKEGKPEVVRIISTPIELSYHLLGNSKNDYKRIDCTYPSDCSGCNANLQIKTIKAMVVFHAGQPKVYKPKLSFIQYLKNLGNPSHYLFKREFRISFNGVASKTQYRYENKEPDNLLSTPEHAVIQNFISNHDWYEWFNVKQPIVLTIEEQTANSVKQETVVAITDEDLDWS